MTSSPLSDEINALHSLIAYLKTQGIEEPLRFVYEPNGAKTAPDYSLEFTLHSVLVEVRNSGDGFLVMPESDYLEPKERYERSAGGMIVKTWLDLAETIMLMISSPVPLEKRSHLAKKIAKQLEIAYRSNSWNIGQKIDIQINTEDVKLPSSSCLSSSSASRDETRDPCLHHCIKPLPSLNAADFVKRIFGKRGDVKALFRTSRGFGCGKDSCAPLHRPCQ